MFPRVRPGHVFAALCVQTRLPSFSLTIRAGAETVALVNKRKQRKTPALWDEVFGPDGRPRDLYRPLLDRVMAMPGAEKRMVVERLEATMREMGVTFDIERNRPWGKRPWFCDALPQLTDIRPLYGEPLVHHAASTEADVRKLRQLLAASPQNYVVQPRDAGAREAWTTGGRTTSSSLCAARRATMRCFPAR